MLAEDEGWPADADKLVEGGPEVSLVAGASTLAGDAERLARAAAGPERSIAGDPGKLESKGPPRNSCEPVALGETVKVSRSDFGDAAAVDLSIGYQFEVDELGDPRGGPGIIFVVVVQRRPFQASSSGASSRSATKLPWSSRRWFNGQLMRHWLLRFAPVQSHTCVGSPS